MHKQLEHSLKAISNLFETMHGQQASGWQDFLVNDFKQDFPYLVDDLDFCFEVLAGKHKLGFTLYTDYLINTAYSYDNISSIKMIYEDLQRITLDDKSELAIIAAHRFIPHEYGWFLIRLFNREYRLGYSNRKNMVTDLHCMLAKSYPRDFRRSKEYYVQEKLNGVRCIAWYDWATEKWRYTSRSQKEKIYNFDMSKLDKNYIYDGEVMSRNAMGNRDFAKTSGLSNSKYLDKSQLVYIIYDILDDNLIYEQRWQMLRSYLADIEAIDTVNGRISFKQTSISDNVAILPPIAKVFVHPNTEYNWRLDKILDDIVDAGGEGVMLRDPHAVYYHSSGSGDRRDYLLKYKKTKTCDLRIIGWNEGKGKYEGMIGSFICEDDDHTLQVNVAGIDDDTRASDPNLWIGKIIEVAYFETSQSKTKSITSLQFPRYKRTRLDKTETSLY